MVLAEIITTGEEVLHGERTDTNARWLSRRLVEIGLKIQRRVTVGDRRDDLISAFKDSAHRADVVIVNGGLGPTVDDLSAEAAALALGEPLELKAEWVDRLERRFRKVGREVTPNNLKQARLPRSAEVIDNPVGTACGFAIRLNRAIVFFTPGVPVEMKRMMTDVILPRLRTTFSLKPAPSMKRLHCFGLAEADLDTAFSELSWPPGLQLGFRAHFPTIEVKLIAQDATAAGQIDAWVAALPPSIGHFVVAHDGDSMETILARAMTERQNTLALAESCTGGLMAKRLVDVPGSSAFFSASFVTYANQAKVENLGVDEALLRRVGAVSLEVAMAMADRARRLTDATHALSISGIAGPDGGSELKPVGTLCAALATPHEIVAQWVNMPDFGRARIRSGGAYLAFDMLRRHLLNLPVFPDYSYIKRREKRTLPA